MSSLSTDEVPSVEYNIFLLVDLSSGLEPSSAHGLFLGNDQNLNGDGNFSTVLDAELATVQAYVDALANLSELGADVEVGVSTFASQIDFFVPNASPIPLQNAYGGVTFGAGDDLSTAFQSIDPIGGTAIWNTAIRGANEFFDANSDGAGETVNLVYVLSDSKVGEIINIDPNIDPSLDDEFGILMANHDAVIDTIIYKDTGEPNDDLLQLDNTPISNTGSSINLVENQADLNDLLGGPLLDNLGLP